MAQDPVAHCIAERVAELSTSGHIRSLPFLFSAIIVVPSRNNGWAG